MTWWVQTTCRWRTGWDWLLVNARTNVLSYPILCWSWHPPGKTPIYRTVRGTWRFCGYTYWWAHPHFQLQEQVGDTINHTYSVQNIPLFAPFAPPTIPTLAPINIIYFCIFSFGGPYGREIHGPIFKAEMKRVALGARIGKLEPFWTHTDTTDVIVWDHVYYDDLDFFNLLANPTRLTIPADGRYLIGLHLGIKTGPVEFYEVFVQSDKLGVIAQASSPIVQIPDYPWGANAITPLNLERWDYLEAYIHTHGIGPTELLNYGTASPVFWIEKI